MLELESLLRGAGLGDGPDIKEVSRVDVALGGGGEGVADQLQGLIPAQQPLLNAILVLEAHLCVCVRERRERCVKTKRKKGKRKLKLAWLSRKGWIRAWAVPSAR